MTQDKDFTFDFYTETSGSFQDLLARLDMNKEDATAKALTYYVIFVTGLYHGGRQLMMVEPGGQKAYDIDAALTEEHQNSDRVTVKFDDAMLARVTQYSLHSSPEETLQAAFVLLEKICDVRDMEWGLGLYDAHSHDLVPLTAEEHSRNPHLKAWTNWCFRWSRPA